MALPPRSFARAILLRAVVIWIGMKLVVTSAAAAGAAARGEVLGFRETLSLAPSAALLLAAFVAGLTLMDARRRNELLFLANLGVSRSVIASLAAIPAVAFEIVLGVL